MTYSANDHPVDTLSLVLEVLNEALDQTGDAALEHEIRQLRLETKQTMNVAREIHGKSPTEKLMERNDTEQLIKDAINSGSNND